MQLFLTKNNCMCYFSELNDSKNKVFSKSTFPLSINISIVLTHIFIVDQNRIEIEYQLRNNKQPDWKIVHPLSENRTLLGIAGAQLSN